jgi:hypothetical protein
MTLFQKQFKFLEFQMVLQGMERYLHFFQIQFQVVNQSLFMLGILLKKM